MQPGGGTVVNAGSIAGSGLGVELLLGGSLVNQAGGTISGGAGAGVAIAWRDQLLHQRYGVTYVTGYRPGEGTITNAGLISGKYGVQVSHSFATVTDSGTIAGSTDAIVFAAGLCGPAGAGSGSLDRRRRRRQRQACWNWHWPPPPAR